MANLSRNILLGSGVVALLVAVLALIDLFMGVPFAGQTMMDVMFLIGAALVLAMAWESFKEQV